MQLATSPSDGKVTPSDASIGRIVSVTGSKSIVMLDTGPDAQFRGPADRPEMGTLLAIETPGTIVLAIVSALRI